MSNGIPISPGCEIVDEHCGDECHCWMGSYCATHQDSGDEWPCDAQKDFEATPEIQVEIAKGELATLRKNFNDHIGEYNKLLRDHSRLTRIVEDLLIPFMRDTLPHIGAQAQVSWGMGDSEPLLGADTFEGSITFNRGRMPGTPHGIVYTASDGRTWHNGTRVPTKLEVSKDDVVPEQS